MVEIELMSEGIRLFIDAAKTELYMAFNIVAEDCF
jgi:hypothetical protein